MSTQPVNNPVPKLNQLMNNLLIGLICMVIIVIGQWVGLKVSPADAFPAALFLTIGMAIVLVFHIYMPFIKIPSFALALLIALIFSLPVMPFHQVLMSSMTKLNFLSTTTPLLAFAGFSMGNNLKELKQVGWKLIIISIFVFSGTFFCSAAIAHLVLKLQGVI